jgi:hypothetical protein
MKNKTRFLHDKCSSWQHFEFFVFVFALFVGSFLFECCSFWMGKKKKTSALQFMPHCVSLASVHDRPRKGKLSTPKKGSKHTNRLGKKLDNMFVCLSGCLVEPKGHRKYAKLGPQKRESQTL